MVPIKSDDTPVLVPLSVIISRTVMLLHFVVSTSFPRVLALELQTFLRLCFLDPSESVAAGFNGNTK